MKNIISFNTKDLAGILPILSDSEAAQLLRALGEYAMTETTPELSERLMLAFVPLKNAIDRANEIEVHPQRAIASRLNGAKGGRPKKQNNPDILTILDIPTGSRLSDAYTSFVDIVNRISGRKFAKGNAKAKRQVLELAKTYKTEDFQRAIENAYSDPFHVETGRKFLTPEFISRPDKFERFLNQPIEQNIW